MFLRIFSFFFLPRHGESKIRHMCFHTHKSRQRLREVKKKELDTLAVEATHLWHCCMVCERQKLKQKKNKTMLT